MKNQADYSQYECPYSHLEKADGHELHGPEGYENTYGVWCTCGFRGPVFYIDPEELGLKKMATSKPCDSTVTTTRTNEQTYGCDTVED
jgi:hypothetical protein